MRRAIRVLVPALIALLASPVLTVLAQDGGPLTGPIYLTGPLVVGPGETLRLGPGAIVTGNGSIEVDGTLESVGSEGSPVQIGVPVRLHGNGSSLLDHTRVWGVPGTGVTQRAGTLTIRASVFEANGVGLAVVGAGDARVDADNVTFRAHASEGARILGASDVRIARSSFSDDTRGLVLDLSTPQPIAVRVNESVFANDAQHLVIELGSAPTSANVTIERNDFGAIVPTNGQLRPNVLVHSDLTQDDGATLRNVSFARDQFHDGDVGLRIEGAGFRVSSDFDSFRANRVGLAVTLARVDVAGASFDDRECALDGPRTARLTFADSTCATPAGLAPAAIVSPGAPTLWPWALGAVAIVAAGSGLFIMHRRRAGGAAPPEALSSGPPIDLTTPLRPMERKVLEDLAAHPGSAQSAVAARMGVTRQALHYHVKKLEARGLVQKAVQGRETKCSVPQSAVVALGLLTQVTDARAEEKE